MQSGSHVKEKSIYQWNERDVYTEKTTEGQHHTADSISATPNAIT